MLSEICQFLQLLSQIGLFPGLICHAKMALHSSFPENGSAEIQLPDDSAGGQVAGFPKKCRHLLVSDLAGPNS